MPPSCCDSILEGAAAQSHFLRGGHAINLHEMQLLVCIIILALLGCVDHVGRVFKDLCKAKEAKPHIFRPFLRLVKRHTSIKDSAAQQKIGFTLEL